MLAWYRRTVFVASGVGASFGVAACTFGSAGAGSGSAGESGDDGDGGDPAGSLPSGDDGDADDDGEGDAAASSGGVVDDTATGPPPGTTTTGDPSGGSSGELPTTTTGGEGAFVLCDATDPELRACYDFVDAESGTLHDLSSEDNEGTVSPQVVVGPGPFGSAVRVSQDAAILVPDSDALDLYAPDMSFDAWVYLDADPPLTQRRGVFDNDGQYSIMLFGGEGLRCGFGHTNVSAPVPFGQWFHVACVGSETGTAIYVDGVQVNVAGPPVDGFPENVEPLAIGDNSPQLDQPLDGEIGAIRIFSRTLSAAEVAEAAAAPV